MSNEHSAKYSLVKKFYDEGTWDSRRVMLAVDKGWITEDECDEILNQEAEEEAE